MRELHVVALSEDGRHVVLATRAGTASGEFRVALDDRLTAAVRGELPAPGREAPPSISPRDIQARLRDGEAPEDIAASAGVPLSRVERYAGPVLAELERMVTGARAAVVSRPRLGASALPLGEAVEAHLAEVAHLAEGSVRWSARRTDLGRWVVEVSWTARGRRRHAGWRYDPATREVAAVDGPSAVLGHVEADAVPAPAGGRSARPAVPAARAARATATGTARSSAAVSTAAGRAVRAPAASTAPSPRQATGGAPGARPSPEPGATARPPASSPRSTSPRTAPAAARRRAATPPATPAAPAPAAAAPPTRRRPAGSAADPAASAPAAPTSPRAPGTSADSRPARRTAATAPSRRPTPRRSAVPSLEDLAAPTADTPTPDAGTAGGAAPPPPSETPAPTAAPTSSPSGPPVLRVVPPAAPEPAPDADAAPPDPQARPVRRAVGQRGGGRDWADVLMGGAPTAPAAEPRPE